MKAKLSEREAYNTLKKLLNDNMTITLMLDMNKDLFVFSVMDTSGKVSGLPYLSINKNDGHLGGYNPGENVIEYVSAMRGRKIDISKF